MPEFDAWKKKSLKTLKVHTLSAWSSGTSFMDLLLLCTMIESNQIANFSLVCSNITNCGKRVDRDRAYGYISPLFLVAKWLDIPRRSHWSCCLFVCCCWGLHFVNIRFILAASNKFILYNGVDVTSLVNVISDSGDTSSVFLCTEFSILTDCSFAFDAANTSLCRCICLRREYIIGEALIHRRRCINRWHIVIVVSFPRRRKASLDMPRKWFYFSLHRLRSIFSQFRFFLGCVDL
jgi:hypothetical protein